MKGFDLLLMANVAALPSWLDASLLGVCIVLAVLTIVLMFTHTRRPDNESEQTKPLPFDPMLFGSALTVIILAIVIYIVR